MNKFKDIKIKSFLFNNINSLSVFLKNKNTIYKFLFKLSIILILSFFASNFAINFIKYKVFKYDLKFSGITYRTSRNSNFMQKRISIERYENILKYNPFDAVINGSLLNFNSN